MKKLICMMVSMVAAFAWGVPSVTVDSVTPAVGAPVAVTVTYTLSGDAVVTAEMFAGETALKGVFDGDVNVLLAAGSHTFRWRADVAAGGTYAIGALTAKVKAWDPESPPDYMAVDLANASAPIRYYATSNDVPGGVTSRRYTIDWMLFRRIPAAGVVWRMGSSTSTYRVKLTYDYYLGVYPLTIGQYNTAYGKSDASISGMLWPANKLTSWPAYVRLDLPATGAYGTWRGYDWPTNLYNDVGNKKLYEIATHINLPVDMPTEAEWEFACRAGCADNDAADLDAVAWYRGNSQQMYTNGVFQCNFPMPVGLKRPNAYGLYDMLGGISEWCLDFYGSYNVQTPYTEDPHGPVGPSDSNNKRVLRGGCYAAPADRCRYYRSNNNDCCAQTWTCITVVGGGSYLAHVAAQDHYEGGVRLRLPARAMR